MTQLSWWEVLGRARLTVRIGELAKMSPCGRLPLLEDLPDPLGKNVLLRVDFNTPLHQVAGGHWEVEDDYRIRSALPTIEWLMDHGAVVTACSHLGRPNGRPDPRYSLAPVRQCLEALAPGVTLLENLRFDPGEEAASSATIDRLVAGQDLFVNDAFGVAHREHASVIGPPSRLPSAAGRLLAREVEVIGGLLEHPVKPFVAIVGGAKVAGKLGVLKTLAVKAEVLMIGGAMAFTFLSALGHEVGESLVDPEHIGACKELIDLGGRVMVPEDFVAVPALGEPGDMPVRMPSPVHRGFKAGDGPDGVAVVGRDIPPGWKGMDIGPKTARAFADELAGAGTVFWNGPMGAFEDKRFENGSRVLAEAMARCGGFTVVGGGDSVCALDHFGLGGTVDFVSTGGGASLDLIEHGDLPGLAALRSSPLCSHAAGGHATGGHA